MASRNLMSSHQRNIRVTKWLSSTPVAGVVQRAAENFKIPMTALAKTKEAQDNLQQQFDQHVCRQRSK